MRLLVERIKPYVDARYRTRCGREDTALAGSSLGGLISLRLMLTYPEVFGRVAAISPSLWWSERAVLADLAAAGAGALAERLWIDGGSGEGGAGAAGMSTVVENSRAAREQAEADGAALGVSLGYMEDIYAEHNEPAWARRLPSILGYLLSDGDVTAGAVTDHWVHVYDAVVAPGEVSAAAVNVKYDDLVWQTWRPDEVAVTLSPASGARLTPDGDLEGLSEATVLMTADVGGRSFTEVLLVDANDEADTVTTVFTVWVPDWTTGTVHLSGDVAALTSWGEPGVPMTEIGPGRWMATVALPRGAAVAYKYTRGGWATVEKGPAGEEVAERPMLASGPIVITDTVASWAQP